MTKCWSDIQSTKVIKELQADININITQQTDYNYSSGQHKHVHVIHTLDSELAVCAQVGVYLKPVEEQQQDERHAGCKTQADRATEHQVQPLYYIT